MKPVLVRKGERFGLLSSKDDVVSETNGAPYSSQRVELTCACGNTVTRTIGTLLEQQRKPERSGMCDECRVDLRKARQP